MKTYKIISIDEHGNKEDIIDLWEHLFYEDVYDKLDVFEKTNYWLKNKINKDKIKVVIAENNYDYTDCENERYEKIIETMSYDDFLQKVKKEKDTFKKNKDIMG